MVIAAGACLFVPLSLSARANHTRASCSKVARFCSSSAVCAIFKHSAANRRYSSDRDIESSPLFGTIGANAERVYGVPYGLAGCGPFLRAMVQSLTSAAALLGATRFE